MPITFLYIGKVKAKIDGEKSAGRKLENEGRGGDEIAGVHLTHPERVLYAQQGITKRDLALYYKAIADWILPQVENRPLTLLRCPEGYGKECFYQRHTRDVVHDAIYSISIREGKASAAYLYIDSLYGLIALVQMGVLEIHTWGSRKDRLERPDRLIFDLDPDPSLPWRRLKEAAETLRSLLSDLGLAAFVKTTGGKGLHIVVPIAPKQDWEFAKDFSKSVAERMVQIAPDQYITTMSKARRAGKIFIDYLRNARTASAVCAYSPRARSGAPVSMPVHWRELTEDVRTNFSVRNVPEHLAHRAQDPWANYEGARVSLSKAMLRRL